jgi:hypothetical protein
MANEQKGSDGLTCRQREFVSAYAINPQTCGKVEQSAIEAGYSQGGARTRGGELLKMGHIQAAIRKQCEQVLASSAPMAISVLVELTESACSESVRCTAACSLLDRAGFKTPAKIEISDHRTQADVDRELAILLGLDVQDETVEEVH